MLLNAIQEEPYYKIGIYSPPGLGKTHLGATAPEPLILLFERQGFETIRTASKMNDRPMPPVIWVRSIEQLSRIVTILAVDQKHPIETMMKDEIVVSDKELKAAKMTRKELVAALPYKKPQTVVIDSGSEALEMVAAQVDDHGGEETKDGLTYRKLNAWGPINKKGTIVIKKIRDLPYHVLWLCLLNERNHGSESDPDIKLEPMLPGKKLPKVLTTTLNALGLLVVRHERDEKTKQLRTRRWVQFLSGDRVMHKCAHPLRPREVADANRWFHALEQGVQVSTSKEELADLGLTLPKLEDDDDEEAADEEE